MCFKAMGAIGFFDSLLKTIMKISMAGVAPISAPCRNCNRAVFRRAAGLALVEKEAA